MHFDYMLVLVCMSGLRGQIARQCQFVDARVVLASSGSRREISHTRLTYYVALPVCLLQTIAIHFVCLTISSVSSCFVFLIGGVVHVEMSSSKLTHVEVSKPAGQYNSKLFFCM